MPIGGEPMIVRVWRRCMQVEGVSRVVVATDDERIRKAVEECGGEAAMTSPGHPSGTDRVAEVAAGMKCDVVVNVQGDEPFIDPRAVERLISVFGEGDPPQVATLAEPIRNMGDLLDTSVVKVIIGEKGNAVYFSRLPIPFRQSFWETGDWGLRLKEDALQSGVPEGYYRHVGMYGYRPDFLGKMSAMKPTAAEEAEQLEQLRILERGYRIRVVVTDYRAHGVDTKEGLERARQRAEEEG
jgi:3-deoxy-manno-octulosonate cytidylyltransferase (CMP-KDO synthetase)